MRWRLRVSGARLEREGSSPPLQRHTVSRLPQHGQGAASGLDNIGAEIERFKEFERQGLRQISLKVYGNLEQAIRVIGEHMVPALSSG